jgi:PAS domain S-box-containing protein
VSNADTKADVARGDHEDVPPLSSSSQTAHFIKWNHAKMPTRLLHEAGYLLLGLVSLGTVTGLYFWLDVPLVAAAFTYLVVLVLLSLVSNLWLVIALCFIGVGCLCYFFAPPIYSFRVDYPQDIVTISAFVITSFVVNFLVTRVRVEQRDHIRTSETLRDANQRLEATNQALRIQNEERKRAEQALMRGEAYLAETQKLTHTGSWAWDARSQKVLHCSEEMFRIYGLDPREDLPTRKNFRRRVHLEDRDRVDERFARVVNEKVDSFDEYRVVLPDGTVKQVNSSGHPVLDGNGELIEFIGTATDVTERKGAEEALRKSEAKIRRLVDSNIIGIFFSDLEGRILEANDAFLHLVGHDRDDLASGRIHCTDLTPPEWSECDGRALAELSSNTIAQPYEKEFFRKDGSRVCVLIGAALLEEGGNECVVFVVDLTERKRAEEALGESERSARSAIDGIAGLLAIMAPNGELETVNRQCLEYFGRSLEWLANWGTNDAVYPEDLPRVIALFKGAMASGMPYHFDQRLRRFDGEYRWFENRGVPIRDDSGRIARWYVLLTDIEDRTQALARLEQMQSDFAHMNRVSMMGELAASLSHEITQPIASARNNARAAQNFLDMQPPDLSEVRQALRCIVRDTDRAGDIVGRIRDHIKKTPPRKEHFDLNEAINEVIVLAQSAIIKNRVWLLTRLSEGLCPVHCDRVQLQQVVLNLILNATEAMGSVEPEPRELLISTEQDRGGVLVAVRDSGPGIDPAHLDRIFEAFYTTKSDGVGMGLSICRSIIDAHGGRLWAEVNEPHGAIFQLTLPAVQVGS